MSEGSVKTVDAATLGQARLRYFDFVMTAFVTVLLLPMCWVPGRWLL